MSKKLFNSDNFPSHEEQLYNPENMVGKKTGKKKTEIQNENLSDSESSNTNSVTMNSMGSNSSEEEMEKLIESDFANKTETTNDITSETSHEIPSETIVLKILFF